MDYIHNKPEIPENIATEEYVENKIKATATAIEKAQTAIHTITSNCTTSQETSGLKVTRTENLVNVEIDDAVTFIFDCGGAF
jgi:precorrin-6B methylase 2